MKPRRHKKNRVQQRMRPQFVDIVCALFKAYKNGPVPTRELERQLGYGVPGKMRIAPHIEKINENMPPEEIQTIVYSVGKENGYEKNLRDWFKLIYQVLFGDIDGPRMGFFVSFFGVKETVKLIKDKVN